MKIYAKKLLTPAGWQSDRCVIAENGVIQRIERGTQGDMTCDFLAPGLFETHHHGGEGYTTKYNDWDRLRAYLLRQAECGITDVLMGLYAHTTGDDYASFLAFICEAMHLQEKGELPGARILGLHLEGPFLNPGRSGGMRPDDMLSPSSETYDCIFAPYDDIIHLVTLAPELPGAQELTAHLRKKGICVQAGHTLASFEQAEEAFGWGVDSICHTFNAACGIHHREPGILTAAFLHENVHCEAICDFHHLHPGIVKLIYKIKGPHRMIVISDSANVTGLPDGEYILHGDRCLVVDGTPRAHGGGTLSGGACYLDGCVRNLISIGIPSEDALRMASETPYARLGMNNRGVIAPGAPAHLAAFDTQFNSVFAIIGDQIYTGK